MRLFVSGFRRQGQYFRLQTSISEEMVCNKQSGKAQSIRRKLEENS